MRLTSGNSDVTHSELRPDDYVAVKGAANAGKVKLLELGVGSDAGRVLVLPEAGSEAQGSAFRSSSRSASSARRYRTRSIGREFAEDVFLDEAVPVWGPVTHGNTPWFTPNVPRYPHDVARARELLKSIGLEDRNNNGIVEDAAGTEARFTVLTQRGITYYERGTTVLREEAKKIGIELDIVALEIGAVIDRMNACNYDAIYMRPILTDLDPGLTLDFWLSSGGTHFWNMSQKTPATEWEKQIDQLMTEQAGTADPARRKALFNDVQRIFAENVPALYFVAPRLLYGHSTRLRGVVPSILRPQVLWNADSLSVGDAGAGDTGAAATR